MESISVVLTTFNRSTLLERVLHSFLNQMLSQENYELIVIDDGSTDATVSVIEKFIYKLPLTYRYQSNAGLSAAKNHGLAIAKNELILFVDDDDILDSGCLLEHVKCHSKYPNKEYAVLGLTRLDEAIAKDPLMHFVTEVGGYLFNYKSAKVNVDLGYDWFWGGRTSFKRQFAIEQGGFNPIFKFGCEDIELGYRMSKKGLVVRYSPKAVSIMIRKIDFKSFCNRLILQGRSQYVFSKLWQEPEAIKWCEIDRYKNEWPGLMNYFESKVKAAEKLNNWCSELINFGLDIEPSLQYQLHTRYYEAFSQCKLAGIWDMENKWKQC